MSVISRVTTWSDNQVLTASALNGEFNNILNDYNGGITNANISASAAIATSKINATFPSGAIVGTTDSQTLTNKTLTAPIIATISNTGTLTLPTSTDTLVGRDTTDTLTNKTLTKPTVNGSVQAVTADSDGATITFDMAAANVHTVTLGGNRTLAVSNVTAGQFFYIRLLQDGTGSRTVTWFSTITWSGAAAPTLTTTANRADLFAFFAKTSTTFDGFIVGQNIG